MSSDGGWTEYTLQSAHNEVLSASSSPWQRNALLVQKRCKKTHLTSARVSRAHVQHSLTFLLPLFERYTFWNCWDNENRNWSIENKRKAYAPCGRARPTPRQGREFACLHESCGSVEFGSWGHMAAKTKGPNICTNRMLYYSITWYQFFGQMIHRPPNSECSAGVKWQVEASWVGWIFAFHLTSKHIQLLIAQVGLEEVDMSISCKWAHQPPKMWLGQPAIASKNVSFHVQLDQTWWVHSNANTKLATIVAILFPCNMWMVWIDLRNHSELRAWWLYESVWFRVCVGLDKWPPASGPWKKSRLLR